MLVSKYFDAQLELYLLEDSRRRKRAETTISLGRIRSDGPKVMPYGELIKRGWLTITGTVTDALTDGEKVVLSVFKFTVGQLQESAIVKIQIKDGETCLIYREPRVLLRKLQGKMLELREFVLKRGYLCGIPVFPGKNPLEDVLKGQGDEDFWP